MIRVYLSYVEIIAEIPYFSNLSIRILACKEG